MKDMDGAIRNGLGKDTNQSSIVKCYVTYVQDLPNGTGKKASDDCGCRSNFMNCFFLSERGKFLALDLGGTNFRVLLIELGENNQFHMDFETFKVPSQIQTGKGTEVIKYSLVIN